MKDLITIIVNIYNGDKYIGHCLDCIINQTYKIIDILIVNDGSNDNTLKICKSYQKKDNRIRIINQKNKGLSLSRRVGIDNSKGKYIYFLDCDDCIKEDTIEYLYKIIKDKKIAVCESIDVYDYNYKEVKKKEEIKLLNSKDMISRILLSRGKVGSLWNKLFDKEVFNDILFTKDRIDDISVMYLIYLSADKIVYSNIVKHYYLKHKNSIVGNRSLEFTKNYYYTVIDRYNYLRNIYSNYIDNEICLLLTIIDIYIHSDKKVKEFINKKKIINKYKEVYKIRYLFSRIKVKEKIKILLFRINPSLLGKLINIHLKVKKVVI